MNEVVEEKCYLKSTGLYDLAPVCLGYHKCPRGHTGPGMRPYHLVHYVESGCGTLYINRKAYHLNAGDTFVIRRGEDATYVADSEKPWTYTWIGFNGVRADLLFMLETPVVKCSSYPFELIRRIPEKAARREEFAAAAGLMIIAEILCDTSEKTDYVTEARHIIETMYMEKLSVAEIAQRLGLDRKYLSRIFHERTGMTVMDYIIKTRMEAARRLIAEDGMSVSRTAELVGYSDPFYFSKAFKAFYGFPPSSARD